jgi:ABC-type antimicrobial peptide transport system permease subunit
MPPESITPSLRGVLASLDPTVPLSRVETMEDLMKVSVWGQQMNATLLSIFAGVALLLASVGVYGVISYSVAQRTHEIGVRMALGAQTWDVRWMVVRQGLKLAVIGVVIGMVCAVGLTRLMTSLLYDVSPTDPLTFAAVAVVLLAVVVLASYFPARRATKVDPMTALRYE